MLFRVHGVAQTILFTGSEGGVGIVLCIEEKRNKNNQLTFKAPD